MTEDAAGATQAQEGGGNVQAGAALTSRTQAGSVPDHAHHTYGSAPPAVLSAEPTQHRGVGAQSQRRTGPMQTHAGHQCQLRPCHTRLLFSPSRDAWLLPVRLPRATVHPPPRGGLRPTPSQRSQQSDRPGLPASQGPCTDAALEGTLEQSKELSPSLLYPKAGCSPQ